MTTQLNNFLSLMSNFGHATEATSKAMESAGSAAKENEAYMGGLEAKTNQVKAAFQELSQTIVNSDMVKGGLDLAIGLMEKLNTKAGATVTTLTLLGGAFTGLAGMAVQGKWISTLKAGLGLLGKIPTKLKLIIGLVGAGAAIYDHFHVSAKEALEEAEDIREQLDSDFGAGSRYDQLINSQKTLNELEKKELEILEAKKKVQEDEAKRAEQKAFNIFQTEFEHEGLLSSSAQSKMIGNLEDIPYFIRDIANGVKSTNDFGEALGEVVANLSDSGEQLSNWNEKGYELNDTNQRLLEAYEKLAVLYKDFKEGGVDAYTAMGVASAYYAEAMGVETAEAVGKSGDLAKSVEDLDELKPEIDITDNALEVIKNVEKLTESLQNLTETPWSVNINESSNTSGDGAFNKEHPKAKPGEYVRGASSGSDNFAGGPVLVNEAGPELISANGRAYIAGDGKPTITSVPRGSIILNAEETENALQGMKSTNSIPAYAQGRGKLSSHFYQNIYNPIKNNSITKSIWEYLNSKKVISKTEDIAKKDTPSTASSTTQSSKVVKDSKNLLKDQNQLFKEQIKILEHRLFLMDKEGASEEDRIEQNKKIQTEIEKQKQWYFDHGEDANSKYIQDLEKQWWKYADEIKNLYKDQANYYDMLFQAVGNKAQDEINILEKQKEELQEQNSEIQKRLDLEKALDELARAKNKKKLVYKDGSMQYVTDIDAVSAAEAKIQEIKNREISDKKLEEIDKKIAKWEEYKKQWTSVTGNYANAQDLAIIFEKLGIDLTKRNWTEQLDNLQSYIEKYNDLMAKSGAKPINLKAFSDSLASSSAPSLTKMWTMGVPTPSSIVNSASGELGVDTKNNLISIKNFNPSLPNVSNGEDFVRYLQDNLWRDAMQFAKA